MKPWVADGGHGAILDLRVSTRASKDEVKGEMDGALRVRLLAPPVDGKANDSLVRFLAGALDVPRQAVTIVAGETSHRKRIRVNGLNAAQIRARLLPSR